jgi:hypothetical protein
MQTHPSKYNEAAAWSQLHLMTGGLLANEVRQGQREYEPKDAEYGHPYTHVR